MQRQRSFRGGKNQNNGQRETRLDADLRLDISGDWRTVVVVIVSQGDDPVGFALWFCCWVGFVLAQIRTKAVKPAWARDVWDFVLDGRRGGDFWSRRR
jgi:hypothetical protein